MLGTLDFTGSEHSLELIMVHNASTQAQVGAQNNEFGAGLRTDFTSGLVLFVMQAKL